MTVRLGFFSWKPSLTSWIIRRSWSSQLLFFLKPACEWLKMPLASARWYRRVWIIRSMVFTMQEVRLTGRYDSIEPAGFPAFSKGMMVAFRQACGTSDSWSDWLKIPSNSPLARGPKAFRKLGGDVVGASRSILPHLLDGSVQLLNAELYCGAVFHAGGVASDLGKSVFLPFLTRELQLAHPGIMSSEGIGFALVRDKDLAVVPDRLRS